MMTIRYTGLRVVIRSVILPKGCLEEITVSDKTAHNHYTANLNKSFDVFLVSNKVLISIYYIVVFHPSNIINVNVWIFASNML